MDTQDFHARSLAMPGDGNDLILMINHAFPKECDGSRSAGSPLQKLQVDIGKEKADSWQPRRGVQIETKSFPWAVKE